MHTFTQGQIVKAKHTPIGEDHEGTEHTLSAGRIGSVVAVINDALGQEVHVSYWVDSERHIVQVYSTDDGDLDQIEFICDVESIYVPEVPTAPTPTGGVPVPTLLTWQHIADLVCSAVEGGSTHWCGSLHNQSKHGFAWAGCRTPNTEWYCDPTFWHQEWKLIGTDAEGDDGPWIVTSDQLAERVAKWAKERPEHLADILNENDDASTGDSFLQYLLLGEEVYG